MNKKRTLLFSIITILIIGLVVTGGTFAYLQWTINSSDGTSVNVTIEHGGVTMHIESEAKEFVGLYPTKVDNATDCARTRYGDALVTIVNKTGTMAVPSFKLKVRVTKGGNDALTKSALEHIRYTVVPIETTIDAEGNPVKGGTNEYNCANSPLGNDGDNGLFINNGIDTFWTASILSFESVATDGSWSHIPNTGDIIGPTTIVSNPAYLPRQYDTTTESVEGITFKAPQYATTYQYYRVYVWIYEGYTTTIIGNTVTDPLQNAKIEVMWSEQSIVQQVTGEGTAADYSNSVPIENVSDELVAGVYDADGNLTTTWDELLLEGKVVVEETNLTSLDDSLSGTIVIPLGITSSEGTPTIEGVYDTDRNLRVEFPEGFTTIGNFTAGGIDINDTVTLVVPATLTTIEASAFEDTATIYIEYHGTQEQWSKINIAEGWGGSMGANVIVNCTDGTISYSYEETMK